MNVIGYQFTKSNIGSDGVDYFVFNLEPERLDKNGLISGVHAVDITRDHKKQCTTISSFVWIGGAPNMWKTLKTIKGEIIEEVEIPEWIEKLGLKIH